MQLVHAGDTPPLGRTRLRPVLVVGAVAAIAVALVLTVLSAPSSAAPSSATSSSAASFAAQARSAGYTSAQVAALQKQVDHYLTVVGGHQVAINEIDYPGGRLVGPLPGETQARTFGTAAPDSWDWGCITPGQTCHGCPYGALCMYQQTNYQGWRNDLIACTKVGVIWKMTGSWYNNQTPGTEGAFYHRYSWGVGIWGKTGGARSWSSTADWSPVSAAKPCGTL
jgi:hypothetical protein